MIMRAKEVCTAKCRMCAGNRARLQQLQEVEDNEA